MKRKEKRSVSVSQLTQGRPHQVGQVRGSPCPTAHGDLAPWAPCSSPSTSLGTPGWHSGTDLAVRTSQDVVYSVLHPAEARTFRGAFSGRTNYLVISQLNPLLI